MKKMTAVFFASALAVTSASSFAAGKVSQAPDAQAIDQACMTDAQTASCGSDQVGTGLMKCLVAYKKAHKKEFKFSEGCKAAMAKAHHDRKAKH